jgi:hypothetical protein
LIRSEVYVLTRLELATLTALEYVRTFWWYVMIVPLSGSAALIFASGPIQIIGLMALLWPLTIPGRSFLSSSKSSRLFTQPLYFEATESEVTFYSESTEPRQRRFIMPARDIRDLIDRKDFVLLRTRRFGFAPIKKSAFSSQEQLLSFGVLVEQMVETRMNAIPDA